MPIDQIMRGLALEIDASADSAPETQPLLEYRFINLASTQTILARIKGIPQPRGGGQLGFETNAGADTTTQRMLIDDKGKVGIGTGNPKARLDVVGDARFSGPLTILAGDTGQSLSVDGPAQIRGTLSVDGDVAVIGKLKAIGLAGDGAELSNVVPRLDSVGNAQLADDSRSLSKISGGKVVVSGSNVGVGTTSPQATLHVEGDWTGEHGALELSGKNATIAFNSKGMSKEHRWRIQATEEGALKVDLRGRSSWQNHLSLTRSRGVFAPILGVDFLSVNNGAFIKGASAIGGTGVGADSTLDVGSRMRVLKGNSQSAGIWLSQESGDRAFIGMLDDDHVGFFCPGLGWGMTMRKTDGHVQIQGNLHAGSISTGTKSFKIDHPLDPANKYLCHSSVESPDTMNIYNGNITTDAEGRATVILPDYFEALNSDFRYQLTAIGTTTWAAVEREIENNTFTIKTDRPNARVSWQVSGIRHDAAAKAYRLPVEQEKPEAEKGLFLHPEIFGYPKNKGIGFARSQEAMHDWLTQQAIPSTPQ